jgi:hypothetical protein
MRGLKRTDLIEPTGGWRFGAPDDLREEREAEWPGPALVFSASNFGLELFCAAHGFTSMADFGRPTAEFRPRFEADIVACQAWIVSELPPPASQEASP